MNEEGPPKVEVVGAPAAEQSGTDEKVIRPKIYLVVAPEAYDPEVHEFDNWDELSGFIKELHKKIPAGSFLYVFEGTRWVARKVRTWLRLKSDYGTRRIDLFDEDDEEGTDDKF